MLTSLFLLRHSLLPLVAYLSLHKESPGSVSRGLMLF